jgi:hypothetical protein
MASLSISSVSRIPSKAEFSTENSPSGSMYETMSKVGAAPKA